MGEPRHAPNIRSKGVVENLRALANPDAVFFGATLLHGGVERKWLARRVMNRNNAHGIFSNAEDDFDGLRSVLSEHLTDATVEIVGCVAVSPGSVRRAEALLRAGSAIGRRSCLDGFAVGPQQHAQPRGPRGDR